MSKYVDDAGRPIPMGKNTKNKHRTKLVLLDAANYLIHEFDITDVPNANTTCPVNYAIQQQCSMLHWHNVVGPYRLEPWAWEPVQEDK